SRSPLLPCGCDALLDHKSGPTQRRAPNRSARAAPRGAERTRMKRAISVWWGTALSGLALAVSSCSDVVGPNDRHYLDVATGGFHTCAVAETGEAYCWGRGGDGEL